LCIERLAGHRYLLVVSSPLYRDNNGPTVW
jgi:hypothetical protein